jgi:hypothetical protein
MLCVCAGNMPVANARKGHSKKRMGCLRIKDRFRGLRRKGLSIGRITKS